MQACAHWNVLGIVMYLYVLDVFLVLDVFDIFDEAFDVFIHMHEKVLNILMKRATSSKFV
jgi:hypothetical protein